MVHTDWEIKIHSISTNFMCYTWSINTIQFFSYCEIAMVLDFRGCGVIMIVTSFTMVTKTVGVFNTQVKALEIKHMVMVM